MLVLALSACSDTTAETGLGPCPVLTPADLPSGAPVGAARFEADALYPTWGDRRDRVTLRWNEGAWGVVGGKDEFDARVRDLPERQTVVGPDGTERFVLPVGDPPLGQTQIMFSTGGCDYILFVEGLTLDEALAYAARF